MTTAKNSLDSRDSFVQNSPKSKSPVDSFVDVYNARHKFFTESFVKKIREKNRRAVAELCKYNLPPTQMDLRAELTACVKAHISDDHIFAMSDGTIYTMRELKQLVPHWASIAEKALIESDHLLADKLMSREQWNARSAFEVTFLSAINEIRDIKRMKKPGADLAFYKKWIISPLKLAMEQVRLLHTPQNSLIGQAEKISVKKALEIADGVEEEFENLCAPKKTKSFFGLGPL